MSCLELASVLFIPSGTVCTLNKDMRPETHCCDPLARHSVISSAFAIDRPLRQSCSSILIRQLSDLGRISMILMAVKTAKSCSRGLMSMISGLIDTQQPSYLLNSSHNSLPHYTKTLAQIHPGHFNIWIHFALRVVKKKQVIRESDHIFFEAPQRWVFLGSAD